MNDSAGEPRLIPALERATHTASLWIEQKLGGLGLNQAQAHILAYLARHAPCAINDLHRNFGHKRSTLTSLLDRLEGRGLVRRAAHPTSRRLVLVYLTDAGLPVAARVSATLRVLEDRVLARVGTEDAAAFLRILSTLEEELSDDHGR